MDRKDLTFRDRVALSQGVESRLVGVKGGELNYFAEAVQVGDGVADGVGVLADLVKAMGVKEGVPRS